MTSDPYRTSLPEGRRRALAIGLLPRLARRLGLLHSFQVVQVLENGRCVVLAGTREPSLAIRILKHLHETNPRADLMLWNLRDRLEHRLDDRALAEEFGRCRICAADFDEACDEDCDAGMFWPNRVPSRGLGPSG